MRVDHVGLVASGRWPLRRVLITITAALTLAATLRLVVATSHYFSFDARFAFFVERPLLTADQVWSACFYVHVAGGIVCLLTAPLLLWNGLTDGSRRLHRAMARVHAVAALGWVGPTGFYLAPFAKGGLAGQVGFGALAALFYVSTVFGVRAIRRGDLGRHVTWMVRSYASLLSALTFRLTHVALHAFGVAAQANYVTSVWVSLVLAIATGELMNWWFAPAAAAAAVPAGAKP